jgi:hypothetical protein
MAENDILTELRLHRALRRPTAKPFKTVAPHSLRHTPNSKPADGTKPSKEDQMKWKEACRALNDAIYRSTLAPLDVSPKKDARCKRMFVSILKRLRRNSTDATHLFPTGMNRHRKRYR